MFTRSFLLGAGLMLLVSMWSGCGGNHYDNAFSWKKGPDAVVSSSQTGVQDGKLGFTILSIHERQEPRELAPGYAPGGEWTFLEAHVTSDPEARFVLGYRRLPAESGEVAWADATLTVSNEAAGDRFLKAFAQAVGGDLPPLSSADGVGTLQFRFEVFGDGVARVSEGVFKGEGAWLHNRAAWSLRGYSGDLYLNLNLKEQRGEWVERDPAFRDGLTFIAAAALRGAPLPHGGTGLDAQLTSKHAANEKGVARLSNWRVLSQKPVTDWGFCPGGQHAFYAERNSDGRSDLRTVMTARPEYSRLVGRTKERLYKAVCLEPDGNRFLLLDVAPQIEGQISSNDPRQLWLSDSSTDEMKRLRGPWDGYRPWVEPRFLAPDGSIFLVQSSRLDPATRAATTQWYAYRLETGGVQMLTLPHRVQRFRGWHKSGEEWHAAFVTGGTETLQGKVVIASVNTGLSQATDTLPTVTQNDRTLSPDGQWRYRLQASGLEIVDRAAEKSTIIPVPPSERYTVTSGCCQWIGSKHLLMTNPGLSVVDVKNVVKMPLMEAPEGRYNVEIDQDNQWLLLNLRGQLSIAKLVLPADNGAED